MKMNIIELYKQTPVERHQEIVISGDRVFFDNEEYVILAGGELKLVHSHKELSQKVNQVITKLGISK